MGPAEAVGALHVCVTASADEPDPCRLGKEKMEQDVLQLRWEWENVSLSNIIIKYMMIFLHSVPCKMLTMLIFNRNFQPF